ncbi:MAG: tetratricopeptide repeat protein, partial [Acidobacteria bacterium]|nr:tetratricopeptide repeat protein [Acidobacteriota bacterium]
SPTVAESLSSLGVALTYNGEFDTGEAQAREALDIYEELLGPRHPGVIVPLNNLVTVLCYRGDKDEVADQLATQALELAQEFLPADRIELGHALTHRALLLARKGEYAEAVRLNRQALELFRRTLGEEHPEVASVLNNLAASTHRQGDAAGAEALYREALALQRHLYGEDSSAVAQALHNVGALLVARGAYEEAERCYREALAIVEDVHGAGHYSTVVISGGLANALSGQGRGREAETLLRQRRDLWQKTLAGSWFLPFADSVLGEALLAQRRFAEAEPLLVSGYEGLKGLRGEGFPRTLRALTAVVDLYEAWGKGPEAERYRALLGA